MTTETPRRFTRLRAGSFTGADRAGIVILGAVFAYTCARAAVLSVTHDEALTCLLHVSASLRDILLHARPIASNNHLLNTLLSKALIPALGNSEFVIRIPALLGHALYLAASFVILRMFLKGAKFLLGLGLLVTNPFLLDFFSCARGYGPGMGLAMWGFYFFLRRVSSANDEFAFRHDLLAAAMLMPAVLANVAFANVFVGIAALLAAFEIARGVAGGKADAPVGAGARLRWLWRAMGKAGGRLLPGFGAGAMCLALVYNPGVLARIRSQIAEYGGTAGLWPDTVGSLLECSSYGRRYAGTLVPEAGMLAVMAFFLAATLILVHVRLRGQCRFVTRPAGGRSGTGESGPILISLFWTTLLLGAVGASLTLQFVGPGTRYATDRSAIYLIPLFSMLVILSWAFLSGSGMPRLAGAAGAAYGAVILAAVAHNLACANLTHFHLWKYDAATKDVMQTLYLTTRDPAAAGARYALGVSWRLEPSTNFYRLKYGMGWLRQTHRRGFDGRYDFYYVSAEDKRVIRQRGLRVIRTFPASGACLAVPP